MDVRQPIFCWIEERDSDREIHYLHIFFILVLGILFIQVRCNADILVFIIEDISLKLSAYVNDAYYFLKDTVSLQVFFQLLSNLGSSHHLKLILISVKRAG